MCYNLNKSHVPNSNTCVQPAAILFEAARRNSIIAHDNVSLARLDRFVATNNCIGRGILGKVHSDRVRLGFIRVAQCDGTDYMRNVAHQHGRNVQSKDELNEPTVNKNGDRKYVSVGVCNLGSSNEIKGCKKGNQNRQ